MEQLLSRIDRLLERMQVFQTQLGAELGRDFSRRLLPKRFPSVDGYSFLVHTEALEQGGGDLLDWVEAPDGSYFVTIGDVMGKGLQAKFYAFSFLSYVRATLHTLVKETASPAVLMERVNEMLFNDEVLEDTFASFLLLRWQPDTHQITYANAGHCPPILATASETTIVDDSNVILGLDPDAAFSESTLTLEPNAALVVFTDGLMEQRTPTGQQLGPEGVRSSVEATYGSDDPVSAFLDAVLERSAGTSFQDDTLVLWLQREAG
jgi:serine phosphatase RsbU (regulator of sigma subunit)